MRVSTEFKTKEVILMCAADVHQEPIKWIWRGWLAKRKIHLLAGQAGTGKTTLALSLAAIISAGGNFPDGSVSKKGSVLIWSGEDGINDTLAPRLTAAGADLTKIHFICGFGDENERRSFDPATDMFALIQKAESLTDLALLIIDPIVSVVKGNDHMNNGVRDELSPLVELANDLHCAVLGITHFSKGSQGKDPLERVIGSAAYGAVARVVIVAAKVNVGEKTKRIVCIAKNNISKDVGAFEYSIGEGEGKAGIVTSVAMWGSPLEGSAQSLLGDTKSQNNGENFYSTLDSAKDFLLEILADGEMASVQIDNDAEIVGFSNATIRRAKDALNIIVSKSKLDKRWYCKLPDNLIKND